MTHTPTPPPPPRELTEPPRRHGRFTSEVMAGGAVEEKAEDEMVGGWRGALGILAIVGLFVLLAVANIWWFVFAVGVLFAIFMHELGHFVTARWTGMKATQFFIGFGPRVWSFRRGETEYGVRALPLGAFVRIIGMNSMDEVEPGDEQRTYRVKSFPRRLLVISAGSIMHMLIAIALLFTVYVADGEPVVSDGAAVAAAVEGGTAADQPVSGAALAAGVQPDDVIVAVDGVAIEESSELPEMIRGYQAGDTIDLTVLRGGAIAETADEVSLTATLRASFEPAENIVAIGQLDATGQPLADVLAEGGAVDGDLVSILVEGASRQVPARVVETDGDLALEPIALLGVSTGTNYHTLEHGVVAAATNSVTDLFPTAWEMTKGVVKVVDPVNVFTHLTGSNDDIETRPTTLIGVGGISDDVGESEGFIGILYLLAILNVFVGVFNMFPLLPLDGGHAAIAVYERIREAMAGTRERYYADVAKLMPFAMGVILLLGFLFMSGLYLDITDPL